MQLFTTKQPSHLSTVTANHRHTQEGTLALVGSYKRLMHLHDLLYDPTCDKCQSNRSAEQAQGFAAPLQGGILRVVLGMPMVAIQATDIGLP